MGNSIDDCDNSAPAITDCWNTIGIRGDLSCPQLKQYIQCRNCPVFTAAAAHLLDIAAPSDYLSQWTRQIAQPTAQSEQDTHSILIFRIAAEWLAMPTRLLTEIASVRPIHSIPHRRDGTVLGVANIRGELLVCVSLLHILNVDAEPDIQVAKARQMEQRFLVLQDNSGRIVCPVDEVSGTHRYRAGDLADVPATVARGTATYTRAVLTWQTKSVGLLDEQLLFHTVNRNLA